MEHDLRSGDRRPVLIQTLHGPIEGGLYVHRGLRTLDWLNREQRFVRIYVSETTWAFESGCMDVNKELVLFVAELADRAPMSDARAEAVHFTREAISLRVAEYDVKGFMHVRGQDPSMVLNRHRQPFVALTSASVFGPDLELATTFLAVNPDHVLGVQTMSQIEPESSEEPEEMTTTVGGRYGE